MRLLCVHDWEGVFGRGVALEIEVWHCRKCGRTRAWWLECDERVWVGPDGTRIAPPRPAWVMPPSYIEHSIDWRLIFDHNGVEERDRR